MNENAVSEMRLKLAADGMHPNRAKHAVDRLPEKPPPAKTAYPIIDRFQAIERKSLVQPFAALTTRERSVKQMRYRSVITKRIKDATHFAEPSQIGDRALFSGLPFLISHSMCCGFSAAHLLYCKTLSMLVL